MSSTYGIKVSKDGFDVQTCANKDLEISSQFDTFKVFKTGTLTLSLPQETLADEEEVTHTISYTHGLGYQPYCFPNVHAMPQEIYEWNESGNIIVNDLEELYPQLIPWGWEPSVEEIISVNATSTDFTISVLRYNYDYIPGDRTFVARDITCYYTIFYNRMDAEFNLL
jgi:hypothetical protein